MINSAYTPPLDLLRRPRRNRQNAAIRALVRENRVQVDDLIQPLFVKEATRPLNLSAACRVFSVTVRKRPLRKWKSSPGLV